jgi:hypothetical protein
MRSMRSAMTLCASRPICQALKPSDNHGLNIISAFVYPDSKPPLELWFPERVFMFALVFKHRGWPNQFMKAIASTALGAGLVLAWALASSAEPQLASPTDGKAMIERAISALKSNEAAALKAFNDEKNKEFRDRDLYVFCFSLPDGNITAYQSPVMIGMNVKDLKIPPNNPVGQQAYDAVVKAEEGKIVSFTYEFPKPGTKASVQKETLEARVGKQACGVSYFKS